MDTGTPDGMNATRTCEHVCCERPSEFLWRPGDDDSMVVLCRYHRDKLVSKARTESLAVALAFIKETPRTAEELMEYADCKGLDGGGSWMWITLLLARMGPRDVKFTIDEAIAKKQANDEAIAKKQAKKRLRR